MSRDVLTVGSTIRIPLLYRGEYSQWVEMFMNYLEEQMDGEEMINSIKNVDQPLPRVTQDEFEDCKQAEAVQIILTGIDNDIYSTVDACSNALRECQKPKRVKDAAYHREKMLLYAADSGPIFDNEPLHKVSNSDHYNVFAIKSKHPEQSEFVPDTYLIEQDAHNVIIDSLDMSCDKEEIDQNDDVDDLANERELLASLIEKLKCEIDERKNRNIFLETSNKVLIEKLKGEIEDFKNKNKSLKSSNNRFKEANNTLSETNNLMYADFKKSQAELARQIVWCMLR
nr:hypothetical protein [Tanacetum cinerariifolium]